MIDGDDRSHIARVAEHRIHVRDVRSSDAIIDEAGGAEGVRMPVKGRQFPARNEQQLIEVRLKLALVIVLRGGVVITDGDKVQDTAASSGIFSGDEKRAWDWHLPLWLGQLPSLYARRACAEISRGTSLAGHRLRLRLISK